MKSKQERCAEHEQFQKIDSAFRAGDLDALRSAISGNVAGNVTGGNNFPNSVMPVEIGPCLEYAIYHSPLAFIRALLEIGADPNHDDQSGFPPLIAALSVGRVAPGATARQDVLEILELLLSFGADPDQRGLNDWTALHMAVAERNLAALQLLLEKGADPHQRTRVDDYETPREMAQAAGLGEFAELLAEYEKSQKKK